MSLSKVHLIRKLINTPNQEMLPRCFIYFGIFALFAVIMSISAIPVGAEEDLEGTHSAAVKIVAKIIGSLFTGAALNCLEEAAEKCTSYWKNSAGAITCAKNFLAQNKGRCAA